MFSRATTGNSQSERSKLLTSCLTAIKANVIKYCETVYERSGKNMFWSIKNSGEVLSKQKDMGYQATSLSTYDFSTLYTTLPHNLIKEKLIGLIERTFFKKEDRLYRACNDEKAFFTSADHYKRGGVAQWMGCRVPGSIPRRCTFRCGLEQVTFTLCLVLVKPRKRLTDDRLGQTVTRLEITLCLMC